MPSDRPVDTPSKWDYFDRIYCITLAERPDRRRQARQQFDKVGLGDRVEFVRVELHAENSEQGIYESHQRCIAAGLGQGAETILVFEDDIRFQGFTRQRLARCVTFLESSAAWQAFFFGCLVRRSRPTPYPSVLAVDYRSLAHAYALKGSLARQVATKPWHGEPYDAMLASFNEGFFAAYPAFAFQSDSASDNHCKKGLDRLRRRFGGLMRIQKANQWFCRHRQMLIALHLAGLAAIIGVFLYFT